MHITLRRAFRTSGSILEVPAEQLRRTIDQVASQVLWETEIYDPPVDSMLVANRLGIEVARDESMSHRARLVEARNPTILIGDEVRPERWQWAIAHEVGEYSAAYVFRNLGISPTEVPIQSRERIANKLASTLLLPREWFVADGVTFDWDLYKLKKRYSTASHELIALRMLDFSLQMIVTLCDQGQITWRRTNCGRCSASMLPEELAVWGKVHKSGRAADVSVPGIEFQRQRIRCWPVHERQWRREILRSDLAGADGLEC